MNNSCDKSITDVFSSQNNGLFKIPFMSGMSGIRILLYKTQRGGRNKLKEKGGNQDTPDSRSSIATLQTCNQEFA